MSSDSIKYILIGNLVTKKEIIEYPPNVNKSIMEDSHAIFEKLSAKKNQQYDERFKIVSKFGEFHFTIFPTNTFYLVLAVPNYPEKDVFDLINELHTNMIYMLVNEKGEISTSGRSKFMTIYDKKKNSSTSLEKANNAIKEVRDEMKKGISKAMSNIEDVQELEIKADNIAKGAELMKDAAKKLAFCAWLRQFKWTLIIIAIVIGVLLVIIVPVAVTLNNEAEQKKALMGGGNNITNIFTNSTVSGNSGFGLNIISYTYTVMIIAFMYFS